MGIILFKLAKPGCKPAIFPQKPMIFPQKLANKKPQEKRGGKTSKNISRFPRSFLELERILRKAKSNKTEVNQEKNPGVPYFPLNSGCLKGILII